MKTVFIYALKDPVTDEIRYIGKSVNPKHRLLAHLSDMGKNHRTNWLESLSCRGLKPILMVVDEIPEEFWQPLEVAYIQFFREEGCLLVNGNDGGEGGHNPSESSREKMCKSQKGRLVSKDCRAKLRAANLGKILSPETIEKMAASRRGKPRSVETRAKISAAQIGRHKSPLSDETKIKISMSNSRERNHFFGKKHSTESLKKMSVSHRNISLETRLKMGISQRARFQNKKQPTQ